MDVEKALPKTFPLLENFKINLRKQWYNPNLSLRHSMVYRLNSLYLITKWINVITRISSDRPKIV